MALTNAEVRKRLGIVRAREDDDPRELARTMNAAFDLIIWLTERELKEPN